MGANLYFVSDGAASAMAEFRYDTEDELQKLIADNPGLLLRDSDPEGARLMLVAREFEMPVEEDGSTFYFLDHLMVDQSGVPVLVEVKRSTDTRTKREVVAQMIDYASRLSTWDAGALRDRFRDNNTADVLEEYDTDDFWTQVATCLKAERCRLVFAADRIPGTLKTMIEFLDRSMSDIEVYGVELRQYKTDNAMLLSSSVVGNALAEQRKAASAGRRESRSWTLGDCIDYLKSHGLEDVTPLVDDLWNFAVNDLVVTCKCSNGKLPTFKGWLGDMVIFNVYAWWTKQKGHICTIDFFLPDHVRHLAGTEWDEAKLRALFMDLPGKDAALEQGLMWETPKCVYIDLHLLADAEFSTAFRKMLVKIRDVTAAAQNSHYRQSFEAPPPRI